MMKRILLLIVALSLLLCLVGCNGDTDVTTTSVTTTKNYENENKAGYARLGFDELVSYLNICAMYGVPIAVGDDDTIADVVAAMSTDGSYIETSNINPSARFFDYAVEDPGYSDGSGYYKLRENADWLSLYVD